MKAKVYVIGLIAVLSIASAATAVPPSPITLVDLSSSAVFDPTTVSGQSSWMIDQINYLNK
ncbi:MAG TPA: hypothetical protein VLM89_13330, partial [Phycisphaerae bacterium]|nr:hypothetical protein [Phycisphaerae bacterium]